jgi:molecular chaperone GrpE (heat shock protein)
MTSSPRELAAQNTKYQRDQEKLIQDLLGILDDLDRACEHWQQAEQEQAELMLMPIENQSSVKLEDTVDSAPTQSLLQRFWSWLRWLFWTEAETAENLVITSDFDRNFSEPVLETESPSPNELSEMVESAHEGVEMIRRSLLDVLRRQQVVPLEVLGKPFDPSRMYALGRQESVEAEENTVVQEVVRGYLWQNRILRESQVMVAMSPEDSEILE